MSLSVMSSGATSEAKMKNKSQFLKRLGKEQKIGLCIKSDGQRCAEKPSEDLYMAVVMERRNAQGQGQQSCGSVSLA